MPCKISFAIILLAGQATFAQVAIQQPVVGTAAVNTTVSVPDRGTTFLGGTSSAQSGRSQYGPLRSGTSMGLSRQSSSISVNVRVIDLQAMDEAILSSRPALDERARHISATANSRQGNTRTNAADSADAVSSAAKAARSEALAFESEKAGKVTVAKLHWKMAAKYGSRFAEKRLMELNTQ